MRAMLLCFAMSAARGAADQQTLDLGQQAQKILKSSAPLFNICRNFAQNGCSCSQEKEYQAGFPSDKTFQIRCQNNIFGDTIEVVEIFAPCETPAKLKVGFAEEQFGKSWQSPLLTAGDGTTDNAQNLMKGVLFSPSTILDKIKLPSSSQTMPSYFQCIQLLSPIVTGGPIAISPQIVQCLQVLGPQIDFEPQLSVALTEETESSDQTEPSDDLQGSIFHLRGSLSTEPPKHPTSLTISVSLDVCTAHTPLGPIKICLGSIKFPSDSESGVPQFPLKITEHTFTKSDLDSMCGRDTDVVVVHG